MRLEFEWRSYPPGPLAEPVAVLEPRAPLLVHRVGGAPFWLLYRQKPANLEGIDCSSLGQVKRSYRVAKYKKTDLFFLSSRYDTITCASEIPALDILHKNASRYAAITGV